MVEVAAFRSTLKTPTIWAVWGHMVTHNSLYPGTLRPDSYNQTLIIRVAWNQIVILKLNWVALDLALPVTQKHCIWECNTFSLNIDDFPCMLHVLCLGY